MTQTLTQKMASEYREVLFGRVPRAGVPGRFVIWMNAGETKPRMKVFGQ